MFLFQSDNSGCYGNLLGNIARWGPLPISMILRSEGSLKSEMLSLARTSKYVKNTSMLSINKSEEPGQPRPKGLIKLDSYCSDKLIFFVFC